MDEIISNNMGLVYKQLHRFDLVNDDEALSQAMEALWVATKTFDKTKNIQFSTYATACIYNALGTYIRTLHRKRRVLATSYHEVLPHTDDMELLDTLTTNETPESDYLHKEHLRKCREVLDRKLKSLPVGNQQTVITMWIDSECTMTQAAIAKKIGISQTSVSRIIKVFKYQLKKELEETI